MPQKQKKIMKALNKIHTSDKPAHKSPYNLVCKTKNILVNCVLFGFLHPSPLHCLIPPLHQSALLRIFPLHVLPFLCSLLPSMFLPHLCLLSLCVPTHLSEQSVPLVLSAPYFSPLVSSPCLSPLYLCLLSVCPFSPLCMSSLRVGPFSPPGICLLTIYLLSCFQKARYLTDC